MGASILTRRLDAERLRDLEYKTEVDQVSESEWPALMSGFADANIYQTWSYGAIRWGQESLSHLVLKQRTDVVGLAQLRIIRSRVLGLGIAYLRWGPLCHPCGGELAPETVQAMAAALRDEYVRKRGLYLEVLPKAFSGSSRAAMFQSHFAGFVSEPGIDAEKYRTLILDLSPSLDELRRNLNKKWRNQLNVAERNGLRIVTGDRSEEFRTFCRIYAQMRERKAFETSVSAEEFARIHENLPARQRMRTMICLHNDQPVAALVCSAMGDSAIYLLGATNADAMKLKAAYLLQWSLVEWLKQIGIQYYDLGGIDPEGNPGVHHFKQGLSGADMSHIGPLIACDNAFSAALVKAGLTMRSGLRRFQLRFAHT